MCDGGLCAPFVVAEDAEVAFHILDYENIVGVVDVGSGGGSVRAHTGVNGDKFVELRLARKLALRLGGQLRLVGEYVDISPFGIGGESERAVEDSRRGATEFITGKLRKGHNQALGEIVDAAFHTGQLGGALTPPERLLD